MKKTLITLAALAMASVAYADYTFSVPNGGNFYAGSYTFQFTIDSLNDVSSSGTTLACYYSAADDGYNGVGGYKGWDYGQNWYTLTNTGNAVTLTVGRGNGVTYKDSVTFTGTLTTGVVYTISSVGANQSQTVTLSGNGFTTESVNYAGNMSGGANDAITTEFNQTFAVSTTGGAVPEPATATLSLLALAGLAARRRRK